MGPPHARQVAWRREGKFALSYLLLRTAIKIDPRKHGISQRARRPASFLTTLCNALQYWPLKWIFTNAPPRPSHGTSLG